MELPRTLPGYHVDAERGGLLATDAAGGSWRVRRMSPVELELAIEGAHAHARGARVALTLTESGLGVVGEVTEVTARGTAGASVLVAVPGHERSLASLLQRLLDEGRARPTATGSEFAATLHAPEEIRATLRALFAHRADARVVIGKKSYRARAARLEPPHATPLHWLLEGQPAPRADGPATVEVYGHNSVFRYEVPAGAAVGRRLLRDGVAGSSFVACGGAITGASRRPPR